MAIEAVIDSSLKAPGEAQRCMKKLRNGLVLLGLPIKVSQKDIDQGPEDDGWDFDEVEEDAVEEGDATQSELFDENKVLGLWEVEKLLFKSNESARSVLVALGLDSLSEPDARTILKRRIELGS